MEKQQVGRWKNPSLLERLALPADLHTAKSPVRGRTFSREQKNVAARKYGEARRGDNAEKRSHVGSLLRRICLSGRGADCGKAGKRGFQKEPEGLFGASPWRELTFSSHL